MTGIIIEHDLPFVQVILRSNDKTLTLSRVLLDTGSAASVFKTDDLLQIGIQPQPDDTIRYMTGIGGVESVVEKEVEAIEVAGASLRSFRVQSGALDYGVSMNGILGLDFLLQARMRIDFAALQIETSG